MHTLRTPKFVALSVLLALLWAPLTNAQQFQRQASTAQGMVGWWRVMPGMSGGRQWYDHTGRFPATLTNMTTAGTSGWVSTMRPGGQGEVRFDGTDDYGALPVSATLEPPAQTWTLWVKRHATGTGYQGLVAGAATNYRNWYLRSIGAMALNLSTTGGFINVDPGTITMGVGIWYHLALTYSSAAGMGLYVDCVLDTSAAASGTILPTGVATIFGAETGGGSGRLSASLDDVRLYDRALSQQELCTLRRESMAGEPRLLPPTLLSALLAPLAGGNPGSFIPFFTPQ